MHQHTSCAPPYGTDGGLRAFFMAILVWSAGLLAALPPAAAQLPPGTILVADASAGTGGSGALFQVDPTTGARTLLSDFGNADQGPGGRDPTGVSVVEESSE